jgi:hypothetical protein
LQHGASGSEALLLVDHGRDGRRLGRRRVEPEEKRVVGECAVEVRFSG